MEYKLLRKTKVGNRKINESVSVKGNVVCKMQTETRDGKVFMRMKKRIYSSDF